MRVDEFNTVVKKIKGFKARLIRKGITGQSQQIVLKVYIQDLTDRINTDLLKVV